MNPKCSNLVLGITLGYPTSDTVLRLKGQSLRLELELTAIRGGFKLYECLLVVKLIICNYNKK